MPMSSMMTWRRCLIFIDPSSTLPVVFSRVLLTSPIKLESALSIIKSSYSVAAVVAQGVIMSIPRSSAIDIVLALRVIWRRRFACPNIPAPQLVAPGISINSMSSERHAALMVSSTSGALLCATFPGWYANRIGIRSHLRIYYPGC